MGGFRALKEIKTYDEQIHTNPNCDKRPEDPSKKDCFHVAYYEPWLSITTGGKILRSFATLDSAAARSDDLELQVKKTRLFEVSKTGQWNLLGAVSGPISHERD